MLAMACSKKQTETPPGVLGKEDIVRVLIDVHLLEAKVKKLYLNRDSSEVVFAHYEQMLFDDMGITKADYERSMEYYTDNIQQMKSIYDEVVDSLLARQKAQDFE
ncbi:uncharacterized protein DUF4296 [Marinoscillum furvescens DSM 4134]|uniref:Uncharacterized protein DUF4296 n=2 Tax=Marinoscillum furvescens TaxID=1026 RepID=A0A3D9L2A1_MARFU|nr:uncharacterized protein DUF4296 [Marinoscillum furvescens DSM 4134]